MEKPILAIDVDGVLAPDQMSNKVAKKLGYRTSKQVRRDKMVVVQFNRQHGPMLHGFAEHHGFELVWATYWEHHANEYVVPAIGLVEDLPVIEFSHGAWWEGPWKYPDMLKYAEGRPLAWLDDEHALRPAKCMEFLKARGDTPTLLVSVSARTGFGIEHLAQVARWKETL